MRREAAPQCGSDTACTALRRLGHPCKDCYVRCAMTDVAQLPADWTEPEQWVWERIAAGELADLNARDRERNPEFKDLDPCNENGWAENRRLRVRFLRTILTQNVFTDATPSGGVRILGAL